LKCKTCLNNKEYCTSCNGLGRLENQPSCDCDIDNDYYDL